MIATDGHTQPQAITVGCALAIVLILMRQAPGRAG